MSFFVGVMALLIFNYLSNRNQQSTQSSRSNGAVQPETEQRAEEPNEQ
jgi:hypothetical protein